LAAIFGIFVDDVVTHIYGLYSSSKTVQDASFLLLFLVAYNTVKAAKHDEKFLLLRIKIQSSNTQGLLFLTEILVVTSG
jgi:hypothetical protein